MTPKERLWEHLKAENSLCDHFDEQTELWMAYAMLELADAVRSLKPEVPEYLRKLLDEQK